MAAENGTCVPRSSGSRSARTVSTSCTTCSSRRVAAASTRSRADDLQLAKWWGLYPQRPEEDGYLMLRVRVPNGAVTSEQLRAIGDLSVRFGRSTGDVTTRQCIQLHWLRIEDVPEIFDDARPDRSDERAGVRRRLAQRRRLPARGRHRGRVLRLARDRRRAVDALRREPALLEPAPQVQGVGLLVPPPLRAARDQRHRPRRRVDPELGSATTSGSAAASARPRAWAGASACSRASTTSSRSPTS